MKKDGRFKRPTIKDIAREANVSSATVSLVLRNKDTSRVGAATRQEVLEIAKRLKYKPNFLARSLVGKESGNIGLILTTLLNPFYAEFTQEIMDKATEENYGVIACSVGRGGGELEKKAVQNLLDRGVDGLIISSALRRDSMVYELKREGVPFVLAMRGVEQGPTDPPVDFIGLDNKRGASMAIDHLLQLGHRRIALIAGPQDTSTGHDRYLGAMAAMEARGLRIDADLVQFGDFFRQSGYDLTKKVLKSRKRPTAIFSGNDIMAVGVLHALSEEGIEVPREMSVVGFDDIEMAGLPGVDLTTVSHLKVTMGRLAVDHLIEKIRGESNRVVKTVLLDPTLVVRRSCGPPGEGLQEEGREEEDGGASPGQGGRKKRQRNARGKRAAAL